MRRLASTLLLALSLAACHGAAPASAPPPAGPRTELLRAMDASAAAWNRGDLEAFVAAYADEALFVSPSGVTRGSGEVLARYRRRYPDGKAMGRLRLELSDVRLTAGGEVSMLGDAVPGRVHGARVLARWTLTRDDGAPARSGPTLIVLERRDGTWRIVEDASMEDEGAPAASGG